MRNVRTAWWCLAVLPGLASAAGPDLTKWRVQASENHCAMRQLLFLTTDTGGFSMRFGGPHAQPEAAMFDACVRARYSASPAAEAAN